MDWSGLPEEILLSIATRMDHLSEYIRIGAVCKSWRSALLVRPPPLHLRFPFLLVYYGMWRDDAFYSPLERKLHPMKIPHRRRPKTRLGSSSSDGWVCIVHDNVDLYLHNPFSGAVVLLPPLICDDYFEYARKAVWSAEPTDPNCIIALLCNRVYYCRPGDARWKVLNTSLEFVPDAIFFNENLYMLQPWCGRIVAIDPHQGREMTMAMRPDGFLQGMDKLLHLVAGPSAPMLVVRHMKNEHETTWFEVFRVDGTLKKWVKTKSLDEGMLFLGMDNSIWFSSSNLKGCKGNSIYFIDHDIYFLVDYLRIFYLEEGSFGVIGEIDRDIYSYEWIVPTL
ncbi:hypothetical protein QJS04_geneDACA006018 [Acorus gramineus]|uniref:F-box protein n=1 Tax=Acorus gramineus TaxID=55184 RepID=A0AAV9B2V7_ACOGR|nr:hypothetical protein QJS04_geneDACA006018 [Acorus gramineus]